MNIYEIKNDEHKKFLEKSSTYKKAVKHGYKIEDLRQVQEKAEIRGYSIAYHHIKSKPWALFVLKRGFDIFYGSFGDLDQIISNEKHIDTLIEGFNK